MLYLGGPGRPLGGGDSWRPPSQMSGVSLLPGLGVGVGPGTAEANSSPLAGRVWAQRWGRRGDGRVEAQAAGEGGAACLAALTPPAPRGRLSRPGRGPGAPLLLPSSPLQRDVGRSRFQGGARAERPGFLTGSGELAGGWGVGGGTQPGAQHWVPH